MGFAKNLILFLFEREREGYKRFAVCTVNNSKNAPVFLAHYTMDTLTHKYLTVFNFLAKRYEQNLHFKKSE